MRNRTEMVTTTLPGSDNEEDASDLDDSEEDWKPVDKKKGVKTPAKTPAKTPGKRGRPPGSGSKAKPKVAPKKIKKEESEDEDDDIDDEEDDEEDFDDDDDEASNATDSKKKSKNGSTTGAKGGNVGAAKGNNAKSFPDKDGKFELYLFKNDLVKDFREDPKLCMWRRDGSSLLQKYIKVKTDDNKGEVLFTASSVYSCWEEKRKNDFFQIGVQCVGEKKDGKVKVIDVEELTRFASEERPKVEATAPSSASGAADDDQNDEDEEEEHVEDDEEEEDEEDVEEEE